MRKLGVAALIAGLAFSVRSTRLVAVDRHRASQRYEDVYYLPPAPWLPLLTLGYQAAAADLLWCKSLVYFGEEMVRRGQVAHIFEYTDAILTLDPDFREPYRWAPVVTLYRAGDFDVNDALRATAYLERAVKRWPNDGELAWDLGSVLRFEIVPHVRDKPLRERLELRAAEHLSTAATLGAGPAWLALNSAGLLTKLGKTEQAIRHLEEVYGTVDDEATKATIAEQLARLRTASYAEAMRVAHEEFERARLSSFPYLSPSLFFVLGPKADKERLGLLERNFLPPDIRIDVPDANDGQDEASLP